MDPGLRRDDIGNGAALSGTMAWACWRVTPFIPEALVGTLPLAGFDPCQRQDRSGGAILGEKDQGWGAFGPGAPAPPPNLPRQGGGAARWVR